MGKDVRAGKDVGTGTGAIVTVPQPGQRQRSSWPCACQVYQINEMFVKWPSLYIVAAVAGGQAVKCGKWAWRLI